jgi:hypothetical protein
MGLRRTVTKYERVGIMDSIEMETLGNLGEFIGSIAVLITLVYLAVQTKQSVKAVRQKSHSDLLARRQDLIMLLTNNRDFIEVFSKGCSRERLDSIDAQRFTSFGMNLSSHVQDAYIQFQAGLIDKEVWEAERGILATCLTQPGFLDWWQHGQQYVTSDFVQIMDDCEKPNMVIYDPQTQSWGRPEDGRFAHDIKDTQ